MERNLKCPEFHHWLEQKLLKEIAVEDEIRLQFHLQRCGSCQQEWDEMKAVQTEFALPIHEQAPSSIAVRRLERRVIKGMRAVGSIGFVRNRLVPRQWTVAVEALLFSATLLVLFLDQDSAPRLPLWITILPVLVSLVSGALYYSIATRKRTSWTGASS